MQGKVLDVGTAAEFDQALSGQTLVGHQHDALVTPTSLFENAEICDVLEYRKAGRSCEMWTRTELHNIGWPAVGGDDGPKV